MNLWEPRWANCLWWALVMYRRWSREGREVYLTCRRSRFLRWPLMPHIFVCVWEEGQLRMWSYCPLAPERRWLPPPVFRGVPLRDDP